MAKEKGTLQLIRPASSIGGWMRMPSSYSSGLSPTPSAGRIGSRSKGEATTPSSSSMNASTVIRTPMT